MKTNIKLWLIFGLFTFILFLSLINQSMYSKADIGNTYSTKLKYNPYTSLPTLTDEYDGIDTFYDDTIGSKPIYWYNYQNTGDLISVQTSVYNHNTVLRIYDNGAGSSYSDYFFNNYDVSANVEQEIMINAWFITSTNARDVYFQLHFTNGGYASINFDATGKVQYLTNSSSQMQIGTYAGNTWYFLEFHISETAGYTTCEGIFNSNGVDKIISPYTKEKIAFVRFIYGATSGGGNTICLDALNFATENNKKDYKLQIQDSYTKNLGSIYTDDMKTENLYELSNTKVYSCYDSLIDEYPNYDNNYRTFFVSDKYINMDMLNDNRTFRLRDTDASQTKYKIIQLYFDNLNDSDSFKEGFNQTINMRVDSLDSSNNLINKFIFNLEFNQTFGNITWKAYYRQSLSQAIWSETLTNPFFRFSDYLPANTTLLTLSVNIHCILAYNSTNKLILLKTDVIFNDNKEYWYSYDKIINAGSGSFYNTQSRLFTRYIDYWNPNNCSDYLNNNFYTFNNLRGIRTLCLNNTQWIFNYLDAGIFQDDLEYYIEPELSENDNDELIPDEPSKPKGSDKYWSYQTYKLEFDTTNEISFTSENVGGSEFDIDLPFEFKTLKASLTTVKVYYISELLDKNFMPDSINLNFGLGKVSIPLSFIKNGIRNTVNFAFVGIQYVGCFIFYSVLYLIMYIVFAIIIVNFWNNGIYWIIYYGLNFLFWIIFWFIVVIWFIWLLLQLLYEVILLPAFIYFTDVLLPLIIDTIILIFIGIVALFIYAVNFGNIPFDKCVEIAEPLVNTFIDSFVQFFNDFTNNMPFMFLYLTAYLINIGNLLIDFIYCRARGFKNRAERLLKAIQIFVFPFILIYDLIRKLKDLVSPTN